MRVATTTIYQLGAQNLQRHIADQAKLQNQLSTGRRVLSPADDPIASARALEITQAQSLNGQYSVNSDSADSALRMTEESLQQVTTLIQNVQQLAVNAGNPTLTAVEKKMLDSELQGRYQELMALANSTDGTGLYLFSGFAGSTKPFTETSFGNVTYNGDDGQRLVQISASRNIPVSESGNDVFNRIKNGNGTFVTAQADAGAPSFTPTNKGSGIISPGEVLDPVKWNDVSNPKDYRIKFHWTENPAQPNKPNITYDIIYNRQFDPVTGAADPNFGVSMLDGMANADTRTTASANSITTLRPYVPGGDIEFKALPTDPAGAPPIAGWDAGIKMSISGTPLQIDPNTKIPLPVGATEGGADEFTVKASTNVDLFTNLADLSRALNAYKTDGTGTGQAAFQNQLNTALSNLSNSLTNVLTVQANIGARMNETDSVRNTNEDLNLQYATTLKDLRDLDYAAAVSDFAQNQTVLDAARQSFAKVQGLSLFQYI
ncbi:flagellar hook-associated protein FlgL [Chitinilyticum litopenaei]|uniref:flagellar hook-associated protein FlgL n=1 Tax=Chitinilyticum litopenaei TaxID=1121276 RepID=UPI000415402E|nr:flagellar hook-associated protein FlgL [Chitinilyticum litopenaei]